MKKTTGIFLCILLFITQSTKAIEFTEEYTNANDFSTPRRSMVNFLANLQDDNYHPERAIKSFNFAKVYGRENKYEKALLFKKYLDAKGYLIDEEVIPDRADFVDSSTQLNRYYPFNGEKDIFLEKQQSKWRFSKVTVAKIDEMYARAYPIGSSWFLKLLPRKLNGTFAGIHSWKWIGLLYLLVFAFVFFYFFRFVVAESFTKILDWFGREHLALKMLRPMSGPASLLMVIAVLKVLFPLIQFPVQVSYYVQFFFKIAIPVLFILVLYRLVDVLSIYFTQVADKSENKMDKHIVPMMRKVIKGIVVTLGLLFILQNLNFNITGLIAGLSIGGLALALAAQDTVKNLLGSLMIYIDKPFEIGDWITGEGLDGNVEVVGFRATRIRTFTNSLMYVPNAKLADMISDNHGKRDYKRFRTTISITHDTPSSVLKVFLQGLREIVLKHPETLKDNYHINLNNLSRSSLDILFNIYFELPDWGDELKAREEIIFAIIELAKMLEVRLAFDTQTLHIESAPGQLANSPINRLDEVALEKRLKEFLDGFNITRTSDLRNI